jgi:hypothetical protein
MAKYDKVAQSFGYFFNQEELSKVLDDKVSIRVMSAELQNLVPFKEFRMLQQATEKINQKLQ